LSNRLASRQKARRCASTRSTVGSDRCFLRRPSWLHPRYVPRHGRYPVRGRGDENNTEMVGRVVLQWADHPDVCACFVTTQHARGIFLSVAGSSTILREA
jgi:hypothetical protein